MPPAPSPAPLRYYQSEAVEAADQAIGDGGRAQLVMACGTGKTRVAQAVMEQVVPEDGLTVYFAPSIALVKQTYEAFQAGARRPFAAMAVCSDETVLDSLVRAEDVGTRVSTDPDVVAEFLARPGPRLLLSTYASAARTAEALSATGPADLMIFDEAHHLAGYGTMGREVLDDAACPARRRLALTATPQIVRGARESAVSMDDLEAFGPRVYEYSFAQGIADGYISDFRIAVIALTSAELRALLEREDAAAAENPKDADLRTAAAQGALASAFASYGIRRVISFHSTIRQAAHFADTLPRTLALLPEGSRPPAPHAEHIEGGYSAVHRAAVLTRLANPAPGGWTVVSNARCLSEGVNVPNIDALLFAQPKRSVIDIVQAVGRALRIHPDKPGPSTVIIPIIVPDGESAIDPREFSVLWEVVRALRAQDASLGAEIDRASARWRQGGEDEGGELPGRIQLHLPEGTTSALLGQLRTMIVEEGADPAEVRWLRWKEQAERFEAAGALVVRNNRWARNLEEHDWVAQGERYRDQYRRGRLPQERAEFVARYVRIADLRHLMLAAERPPAPAEPAPAAPAAKAEITVEPVATTVEQVVRTVRTTGSVQGEPGPLPGYLCPVSFAPRSITIVAEVVEGQRPRLLETIVEGFELVGGCADASRPYSHTLKGKAYVSFPSSHWLRDYTLAELARIAATA